MKMITVEELYNHFNVLNNAKDNASQHEDSYIHILSGLKSGSHEKRLASQFAARFFKFFPNHAEQGIESLFDLCEDADPSVRKQAIKDLPVICKACPNYCQKVSNVLIQLLHGSDTLEMSLAQMSLMSILRVNAKATLAGIFGQILEGEETVRTKAIGFLASKMKVLITEDVLSKDGGEEYFISQCKKVLTDVTGSEFTSFMKILSMFPSMSSLQGRLQLLEIISDQAELSKPFDATDLDGIACLVQCIKQAVQLFSKNVHSHHYVEYICLNVLPCLNDIPIPDVGLELVRLLAEMVAFCGPLKSTETCVQNVFNELLSFMPLPRSEGGEADLAATFPKLQFTYVECLMHVFHQLARNVPLFLVAPENADRLKDFRLRLQYFGLGVQVYMKSLRSTPGASNAENVTEEVKTLALKTTGNINTLIKDLFHNPPSYKASITLSFKKPTEASATGHKRTSTEAGAEEQGKKAKLEQAFYVPPGRKNVHKTGSYTPQAGRGHNGNRNGNFQRY